MTCGFCGSVHNVQTIQMKNGYNQNRQTLVICCGNCRNLLTDIALMLSLYLTMDAGW